jgi:hypothetical protein
MTAAKIAAALCAVIDGSIAIEYGDDAARGFYPSGLFPS